MSQSIDGYKKLVDLRNEPYGLKDYLKTNNIKSARVLFAEKSKMLDAKLNYKNDQRYKMQVWKCESCGDLEDQPHLMICSVYQHIRSSLDLDKPNDLLKYFNEVMKIRITQKTK